MVKITRRLGYALAYSAYLRLFRLIFDKYADTLSGKLFGFEHFGK